MSTRKSKRLHQQLLGLSSGSTGSLQYKPNSITSITDHSADLCALSRLPESLVRLDLKGNLITTIHERALKPLKRLQVLNLRNNTLSSLPAMSLLPRLRTLYLEGNLWNCTCELLKVKRELLARDVDMSTEFCTESVHSSLDMWQAYIMAQEMCEEQNRALVPDSHTGNSDNEEYDDYDF